MSMRAYIKGVFYKTGLVSLLDLVLYRVSYLANRKKNRAFQKAHPDVITPPDYFLYETHRLDYAQFVEGGEVAAREILEWTSRYLPAQPAAILDWGCGVSRIPVSINKFAGAGTTLYACDINPEMIAFNKQAYHNIRYSVSPYEPPLAYADAFFDLVYSLSVFTHIEGPMQEAWIREIHRVLKTGGVFLFTTHGQHYNDKLLPAEKKKLEQEGVFTKAYGQKGHRMMSTYNSEKAFRKQLAPYFDVLEFYDGQTNMSKVGGQDLWIARKRLLQPEG